MCCVSFLFLDFVSDAVYVDLNYDDVFVIWLIVVCEWVVDILLVDVLLVMGCCVGRAWRCCYELYGCVNGASPVGFVLSLFYLCAFQMNPVCVVCVVTSAWGLLFIYWFVTRVTSPND